MMRKTKKSSFTLLLAAGLAGGAAHAVLLEGVGHAQSSTAGEVRGVIRDQATGEGIIGATVVIKGPALQGQQAEITDENGAYVISSLPPGDYVITVFYNEAQFDRPNVLIQVGKQAVVNISIDIAEAVGGETIIVEGRAPIVDQGSTKTGTTITAEYTNNIPVGRTFGQVLGAAAGSQGDLYGVSFSGSTSVESTYIVEGINTTDTAFGGISSNLPNEFVQETEIITGGYNAEFGRSTGGVINVVTKQGGNDFHGSVFGYFTPGALVAESNAIVREGSSIDTETNLDYSYDLGAELGGPVIKDKVWFHVGINPSQSKYTTDRIVSTLIDEDGDGVADVDPATGFTRADEIDRSFIPSDFTTYFFTAKLNGAISENHQWQVSTWGNPRSGKDVFDVRSAPSRWQYGFDDGAYDAALKWTSKLAEGKSQIDAVVGFHRGYAEDQPLDDLGRSPQVFSRATYERSLTEFGTLDNVPSECMEADPDTGFINCPVIGYGTGGLGFLEQRTNDRLSGALSLTQRVKVAGYHTFKIGLDTEQTTYDANTGFTGGYQIRKNTAADDGSWRVRQYLTFADDDAPMDELIPCGIGQPGDPQLTDDNEDGVIDEMDDPDAACTTVAGQRTTNTANLNLGAYLQDSWQIRPNLTINAGLRWEQQTGYAAESLQGKLSPSGEIIPAVAFKLENQLAPRLGVIYDPTQEGRAKLFGHWGRFYETMPMDINVRAFGGEILLSETVPAASCPDANGEGSVLTDPDTILQCGRINPGILGGGTEYVAPGTKGQYLDELILGTEYELMPDFKIGMNYVHRNLPIVIEDMSADSANYYLIGNPGEDYDALAETLYQDALDGGLVACTDGTATTENCALAFENEARSFNVSRIDTFDKPYRTYDALQLTANQRFSKNALVIASYTYSREFGNYPGLFSTETGQLDPNLTSMYDLQDLMANRYGAMGLDRPHNFKIDGFYQFDLKDAGIVVLGGSFRTQSGLAQNTLGSHFVYGSGESYLLSRGGIDRGPATWSADVKATYGRKIGKNMRLEGFLDVFNVTNNQAETDRDEIYTYDSMNPIVGGDTNDLRHGKALDGDVGTETGTTAIKNKNFGNLQAHQAPLSMRFGIRLTF